MKETTSQLPGFEKNFEVVVANNQRPGLPTSVPPSTMLGELLNSSSSSASLNQAEEPQHHPRSKFLELPAELRLMIYDNLFSSLVVHINQRQDFYGSTHTYFIASACMEPKRILLFSAHILSGPYLTASAATIRLQRGSF
jgi:hypothetical protein